MQRISNENAEKLGKEQSRITECNILRRVLYRFFGEEDKGEKQIRLEFEMERNSDGDCYWFSQISVVDATDSTKVYPWSPTEESIEFFCSADPDFINAIKKPGSDVGKIVGEFYEEQLWSAQDLLREQLSDSCVYAEDIFSFAYSFDVRIPYETEEDLEYDLYISSEDLERAEKILRECP